MPDGIAIGRQWVFVLSDGSVVMDWGNGWAVDLAKGEYVPYNETLYSHPVLDDELETLKRMGRVAEYDHQQVFVTTMPENPPGAKKVP